MTYPLFPDVLRGHARLMRGPLPVKNRSDNDLIAGCLEEAADEIDSLRGTVVLQEEQIKQEVEEKRTLQERVTRLITQRDEAREAAQLEASEADYQRDMKKVFRGAYEKLWNKVNLGGRI